MEKIRIFVACHKPFSMPIIDQSFQPIHVGAQNSTFKIEGAVTDDSGDNISRKNPIYCELTGLYWIWKNFRDAEYVGLCHYRRFFSKNPYSIKNDYSILKGNQLLSEIKGYDIILPQPAKKKLSNHYFLDDSEYQNDRVYIEITNAIKTICPEYLETAISVLKNSRMSFGNMMFSTKGVFDKYCEWLFPLESFLEDYIVEKFASVDPREMGFISEWLLNIWVIYNKLRIKYIPVCKISDESKPVRLIKQIKSKFE